MKFPRAQARFAVSMAVGARLRENTLRFDLFSGAAYICVSFDVLKRVARSNEQARRQPRQVNIEV